MAKVSLPFPSPISGSTEYSICLLLIKRQVPLSLDLWLLSTFRSWLLGYEHDAAGGPVPGATISPQHQYNLAEMGLAWHEHVEAEPVFAQFVEHIKNEIRGS